MGLTRSSVSIICRVSGIILACCDVFNFCVHIGSVISRKTLLLFFLLTRKKRRIFFSLVCKKFILSFYIYIIKYYKKHSLLNYFFGGIKSFKRLQLGSKFNYGFGKTKMAFSPLPSMQTSSGF